MRIKVDSEIFDKVSIEEVATVIDALLQLERKAQRGVEILSNIDYKDGADSEVDYTQLFDLEELLEEQADLIAVCPNLGANDKQNLLSNIRLAVSYFNEAVEILDVFGCSNTILDCATMLAKLRMVVAQIDSLFLLLFSEVKVYLSKLAKIKDEKTKQEILDCYPDMAEDVVIVPNPGIKAAMSGFIDWESNDVEQMIPFIERLLGNLDENPSYRFPNEPEIFEQFVDICQEVNPDILEYSNVILHSDMRYIVMLNEGSDSDKLYNVFEMYPLKLNGRTGEDEAIEALGFEERDLLTLLDKITPDSELEELYNSERTIMSQLDLIYLKLARAKSKGKFEPTSIF